jgi:hypothetical protein
MRHGQRCPVRALALCAFLTTTSALAQPPEVWVREAPATFNERTRGGKVRIDQAGNVYVLGAIGPTNRSANDLLLLKYDPDGRELWSARLDGGGYDWPLALAFDSNQNAIVGGASTRNQLIAKFTPEGSLVWRHIEPNSISYEPRAGGTLLVASGQAVVFSAAGLITKLDATGQRLWYQGALPPASLAADEQGQAYLLSANSVWALGPDGERSPLPSLPRPFALCAEPQGHLYIGGSDAMEYGLLCLTSEGLPLWRRHYTGYPAQRYREPGYDWISGIRRAADGSLFVTGRAVSALRTFQPVSLRLDAVGRRVWTARLADRYYPTAMALDARLHVWLAGQVGLSDGRRALSTVCYDPAGTLLWEARYDDGSLTEQTETDLALDPSGGAVITGTIGRDLERTRWITIKYHPPGQPGWPLITKQAEGRYETLGATTRLEVQAQGAPPLSYQWVRDEAPVPGGTGPVLELGPLTPSATGVYALWVSNTLGAVRSADAVVVVLDQYQSTPQPVSQSAVLGGSATFTTEAASRIEADLQWLHDGRPLPDQTNVTLTLTNVSPASAGEYTVLARTPLGSGALGPARLGVFSRVRQDWAVPQPSFPPKSIAGVALRWSAGTNLVTMASAGSADTLGTGGVAKLDLSGKTLWVSHEAGGGVGQVDSHANVITARVIPDSQGTIDFEVIKLDPEGQVLWRQVYGGDGFSKDGIEALELDRADNVIALGFSLNSTSGKHSVTLKYDPNGQLLWRARLESGSRYDFPAALALGADATVHVVAAVTTQTGQAVTIVKYSPQGQLLWRANLTDGAQSWYMASSVAVDPSGAVYALGSGPGAEDAVDTFLVKLDSLGRRVWGATYDSPEHWHDRPAALCLGPDTSVYAAVMVEQPNALEVPRQFYLALRYADDGRRLWAARYDSPSRLTYDAPKGLAVDAHGAAYLTGSAGTVKFASEGHLLWVAPDKAGTAVLVDAAGSVFVAGTSDVVRYTPVVDSSSILLHTPPPERLAMAGSPLELSVTIDGTPPFQLQWTRNGAILPGQTNTTLRFDVVQLTDGGLYALEVADATGLVARPETLLTVASTPQPEARLEFLEWTASGLPAFRLTGPSGRLFRLETSEDLVRWVLSNEVALGGQGVRFELPFSATVPRRFLRAVSNP